MPSMRRPQAANRHQPAHVASNLPTQKEHSISAKEIEVVIRGGVGSGVYSAAQATVLELEAEGTAVDLHTILAAEELAPGALL